MPVPMVATLARRYRASRATVEKYWNECKEGIKPGQGGKGYGLVVKCVRQKLAKRKK